MSEHVSVMTRKGQITVPADIRRALGLREGDQVAFVLTDPERRQVSLQPVRSVAERTHGVIAPRRRPEDFHALRQQFEDDVAEEALAELRPGVGRPS
ncbi:MAG TPA: AbrB/MazE/SpoVT family DNA-binding domain-containing protein [Dehalococcoidia bacterium]|nr:AbrB/MazE/SpoVT family DNA-binding domain-containing protein [Dehalococcoidia bacterium]